LAPRVRLQDGVPGCTPPCHADQLPLPVQMGNSAYSSLRCSACTLGFKACDATRGRFVYVTNAHCTRDAQLEQAWIGSLTRHVSRSDAPGCPLTPAVGQVAGHADPCDPTNDTVDASKIDSDFSLTSSPIRDIGFPYATPGVPMLGMVVQKSGRTTGLTYGVITGVGMTIDVPANEYVCGPVTLVDQILITPIAPSTQWSADGDSGSAVLDLNAYLVGLNFASTGSVGVANTIQNVLSKLDLTLNLFGCADDCPYARTAEGAQGADDLLALGYRFRDQVLPRSERGKAYAELFERHASEVVSLMVLNPTLLLDTREALEHHRETLRSLAERGQARVSPGDLTAIKKLLAAFAARADGDLRATLQGLIRDVDDPAVQAAFGIQVR
ncbi:MAG: S1 family peptidase, partial [Thermoanaerobaculia bacterium]|nr:S1 family peptidase [Thermoanaerobaculia bacterium]